MSATRSSITAMSSKGCETTARSSSRNSTRSADDGQPVVFSAHGVPKSVPADAADRDLFYLDATCPLVSKVHKQAMRHASAGRHVILIGHARPPGSDRHDGAAARPGTVTLIETVEDAAAFQPADPATLGFVTQTTLSVDDTADIIAALQATFPGDDGALVGIDLLCHDQPPGSGEGGGARLPISSSSSARRIRPTRSAWSKWRSSAGAAKGVLVQRAAGNALSNCIGADHPVVGMSAGASAPEVARRRDHRRLPRALRRHDRARPDRRGKRELSGHAQPCATRRSTNADMAFVNGGA